MLSLYTSQYHYHDPGPGLHADADARKPGITRTKHKLPKAADPNTFSTKVPALLLVPIEREALAHTSRKVMIFIRPPNNHRGCADAPPSSTIMSLHLFLPCQRSFHLCFHFPILPFNLNIHTAFFN
jgi:hypothetical protein